MPVPPSMAPQNGGLRIYDRFRFGSLVDLATLDDRQYRSPRACLPFTKSGHELADCPERLDPARSLLGQAQEAWLGDMLRTSRARWTVVAQQTLMAELARGKPEAPTYWMDGWDGYPATRQRLLDAIASYRPANPVILGGDRHAYWVADLAREKGPAVATEFVGTSITSDGPAADSVANALKRNPHLKYGHGDARGYATVDFQQDKLMVGFEALSDVRDEQAGLSRLATFAVEAGRVGAHRA
jgi:alkaline phosphatase D